MPIEFKCVNHEVEADCFLFQDNVVYNGVPGKLVPEEGSREGCATFYPFEPGGDEVVLKDGDPVLAIRVTKVEYELV